MISSGAEERLMLAAELMNEDRDGRWKPVSQWLVSVHAGWCDTWMSDDFAVDLDGGPHRV